jgi:hypothetical protein
MAIKDYLKIKIFQSIKEISLYNYIKYLETNDIRYFSTFHEVLFPYPISQKKLIVSKDEIFNELVKDNQEVAYRIEMIHKVEKLRVKYDDVNRLINLMLFPHCKIELLQELRKQLQKWGYKIRIDLDIYDQLIKIRTRSEGLISEINSLVKEIEKSNISEKFEIEDAIFNIEQGLDMKYKIDTKKTSLFEWVLMQKRLIKKIEQLKKDNKK